MKIKVGNIIKKVLWLDNKVKWVVFFGLAITVVILIGCNIFNKTGQAWTGDSSCKYPRTSESDPECFNCDFWGTDGTAANTHSYCFDANNPGPGDRCKAPPAPDSGCCKNEVGQCSKCTGAQPCGDSCCPSGTTCQGGGCCPINQQIGAQCCEAGNVCCKGDLFNDVWCASWCRWGSERCINAGGKSATTLTANAEKLSDCSVKTSYGVTIVVYNNAIKIGNYLYTPDGQVYLLEDGRMNKILITEDSKSGISYSNVLSELASSYGINSMDCGDYSY